MATSGYRRSLGTALLRNMEKYAGDTKVFTMRNVSSDAYPCTYGIVVRPDASMPSEVLLDVIFAAFIELDPNARGRSAALEISYVFSDFRNIMDVYEMQDLSGGLEFYVLYTQKNHSGIFPMKRLVFSADTSLKITEVFESDFKAMPRDGVTDIRDTMRSTTDRFGVDCGFDDGRPVWR